MNILDKVLQEFLLKVYYEININDEMILYNDYAPQYKNVKSRTDDNIRFQLLEID